MIGLDYTANSWQSDWTNTESVRSRGGTVDLHITLGDRGEHATRIYRQLLDAILDGRLRAGTRLPATRTLAQQLAVSRTTVALAYDRLVAEGYLHGRVGAGTFVASDVRPQSTDSVGTAARAGPAPRAVWASLPLSDTTVAPGVRYAFAIGLPDLQLFPFEEWRRLVVRELRVGALGTGDYGDPAGLPRLRDAVARHYGVSRGLQASAEDVLVTRGAQQAVDLITRVLVDPRATVAVEDPGYPPVRHVLASHGARVVGVPVDTEGLVVDALPTSARLVYVTPSHQFALGVAMSPARRAALLDWASRRGAVVIEDDYDSEFRFTDRPLQPLHSIDRSSSVVYIGTFAKTMFPALRLGFLIAPPSLRTALRTAKQLTDWHTDTVSQAALAGFIDEGLLARHLKRAARHYAARRAAIQSWLSSRAELFEQLPSSAGLHLTARIRPGTGIDVEGAVERAAGAGVVLRSLAPFHVDTPARPGLLLGYGAIPVERIAEGLRHLGAALR
jgi:GntR family transcriptional regulator/MocR family aminotransferase